MLRAEVQPEPVARGVAAGRENNKGSPLRVRNHRKFPGAQKDSRSSAKVEECPALSLEQTVQSLACYTNEQGDRARRAALDYLEKILARWTMTLRTIDNSMDLHSMDLAAAASVATTGSSNRTLANNHNNPWQRPRVALVSFGSCRLGVHRSTSDMDVVAVAPPSCSRHDFFSSLVPLLRAEKQHVSDVHPIPGAYTPVIKFSLMGFAVDMVFARVADASKLLAFQHKRVSPLVVMNAPPPPLLPRDEYIMDDSDLMQLDQAGVRSVNGARVCQTILQLVPDLPTFRVVLKAVKEWAVQAGIYSNVLGFLGGVNWAILVTWICVRHPSASSETILQTFFRTFACWKWPRPVLLGTIQEEPPLGVLPMPAWNPSRNPRDGLHIMPIITPCYPSMNSSYNVGIPQLRRIQDEFIVASNHLRKQPNDFAALFNPSNFFARHEHFLQITMRASNRQDFVEWFRLVESRLRNLIANLETPEIHAWPFCKFFDCRYNAEGAYLGPGQTQDPKALHESLFFIALRFEPLGSSSNDSVNLQYLTSDFLHKLNSWENRKAGMDLCMKHVRSADLPAFCLPAAASARSGGTKEQQRPHEQPPRKNYDAARTMADVEHNFLVSATVAPTGTLPEPLAGSIDRASPYKKCRVSH